SGDVELTNEFSVSVPVDEAWAVLTDLERIAPCMPGAELQEIEGDEYRGVVKVKVGPITASYKGVATFQERDDAARRAVIKAEGRETRGQGNASATITATLVPDGDGTRVAVITDLTVTGKVAQFGRGVMADVSAKLLGQFVESLEVTVLGAPTAGTAPDLRRRHRAARSRATGRLRGRRPAPRRLARRHPQPAAAPRRHADADPLLAGRRARAHVGRPVGVAGWRARRGCIDRRRGDRRRAP